MATRLSDCSLFLTRPRILIAHYKKPRDPAAQFLVDHIERVIYRGYKVTVTGSVPVQAASGPTNVEFRIAGEIDEAQVRRDAQRKIAETRAAKRAMARQAAYAAHP
jgi:hypothetical protein